MLLIEVNYFRFIFLFSFIQLFVLLSTELDGKTAKMYRGGKICMTDHFKPLWSKHAPKFGLAHAMALGLGPWLAVEIPDLLQRGVIAYKEKGEKSES